MFTHFSYPIMCHDLYVWSSAKRLFAGIFIAWTVLHFYLKIGRNEPCFNYPLHDDGWPNGARCWTALEVVAVILPCVKACHKLTTIYTCLCMQDCPIYNQLDWHHPQGAGITVLIAMTGMVLVCALYSKLAPWQNQMFKHCDSMNLACNPCSKLSQTIWTITDPW